MSFATMKKQRQSNFSRLNDEIDKLKSGEKRSGDDDRFWKPEIDKTGNGYAVIRFLPPIEGEDLPWVRIFNHGFKGPGGWYIENSLTTVGKTDPMSEYNSQLWNSGIEANKDLARKQKRRLSYISNIVVVEDPKHPENEGKVFLYKFGKRIFDKVNDLMSPQFEDEKPTNPFDFWEGANFKLKIRKVEGYTNYDKSEFAEPVPFMGGDDVALEEVWKMQFKLQDFVGPDNFKTYEELKARLEKVLNVDGDFTAQPSSAEYDSPGEAIQSIQQTNDVAEFDSAPPSDGDTMSYFAKLANE